jgi:drug/metabolite transporter (DMT)-like permease
MKAVGIILIVIGIAMALLKGINFTTEKEVVDLGPVEINRKENKTVAWPTYAGIAVAVIGAVILVTSSRKSGQ